MNPMQDLQIKQGIMLVTRYVSLANFGVQNLTLKNLLFLSSSICEIFLMLLAALEGYL